MFIGLLLRAMKNDINLKRVAAFAKRLLQVSLSCKCLVFDKIRSIIDIMVLSQDFQLHSIIETGCHSAAASICMWVPFPSL